jgi:hypothetical protein
MWKQDGTFDWPTYRGYRGEEPARINRNCQTCHDRDRCTQLNCLCELRITIDGHPDTMTLTFAEAQALEYEFA